LFLSLSYNPASQIASRTLDNDAYAWTGHYAVNRPYTTNGLDQYLAAGGPAIGYDANGNLISDGVRTYAYDIENRLVSMSNGAALSYDPLGRLFQVTLGTSTTRFLYDGDDLVAEYDGTGAMTRRYVLHGVEVQDGDTTQVDGKCGDRSTQFFYLTLDGPDGATLQVIVTCLGEGCPDAVVHDRTYDIPGSVTSGQQHTVYFKI
jgi:YD repeat-containing protein